ncbi:MAG TPA: secretin N-terminal domain-containing protein, partial [Phycisphaerales bacterium]|nr:secretin N-terminal domain-containing protein [Phycisphaerales bacterium]
MQRPTTIRSISTRVLVAASLTAAAGAPVSIAQVGATGAPPAEPLDRAGVNTPTSRERGGQGQDAGALRQATPAPLPAQPAPGQPAPAQPEPQAPAPQPGPQPTPQPGPEQPAPAQPIPAQPAPAQSSPPAPPAPVQPAPTAPPVQEPPKPPLIKFTFKDMPFDLVLDYFSRESGLPIIREAPVPAGAMTFVGSEPYTFEDALSILNLNLAMQGVHLRKQDQYLYLASLADSVKKSGRVESDTVPSEVKPDQYLTLTIPLLNAQAALVAEQIKPLIGPYGGVQAVPAQNMVIVMESAAQCRRIREIVQAIDQVKPADQAFKLFPLKYAQADAVFAALRGLIGERVRQTFIGADGKATTVTDTAVQGVNITPDPRTNSLLVVGLASRIKQVEELLTLLDIPESGQGESQMMTFTLATLSADAAAQRVSALFQSVPANRKPTVLPLPEAGKLTIIGAQPFLLQAMTLLGEVDGGGMTAQQVEKSVERKAVVAKLKFVTPAQVEQIATRLMTPRQAQVVRMAPTPDGRGLVITGPAADVDSVQEVVRGMDAAPDVEREARMVKIAAADPAALIAGVQDLYARTGQAEKEPVTVTIDGESKIATLIGSRAG